MQNVKIHWERKDLSETYAIRQNLNGAEWSNTNLSNSVLSYSNLENAKLNNANLTRAVLTETNLTKAECNNARFREASLVGACFADANLTDALLDFTNLTNTNFTGAILKSVSFACANLKDANLTDADLTNADLTGANLSGINLERAIGIGTKENEIQHAQQILEILDSGEGTLNMDFWHTCQTSHCLAGWILQDEPNPAQKASLLCPTLAQFFLSSEEEAMNALENVASGKMSVFPD
jgi:uncharacterized protein YjbI with pentapeptide repeats